MVNKLQQAFEEKAFGKPTIVPRFFEHAKPDQLRTAGYGINIYTGRTYIEIKTSGRRDTTTREATADDKALFHEHYGEYQSKYESNAIPMDALAGYSKANEFILRDLKVITVEELAEYTGHLPLASLKLMQHCAVKFILIMAEYNPPAYHDDVMEVQHETNQAQRQVLPGSEGLVPASGQAGNNGGGVQPIGVSLNEEGQIIELNGRQIDERDFQKETQREEKVQKVISFY